MQNTQDPARKISIEEDQNKFLAVILACLAIIALQIIFGFN